MKTNAWFLSVVVVVALSGFARAQPATFVESLTSDEIARAGLSKLSAEERAALNELVARKAQAKSPAAQTEAATPVPKASGLLQRARAAVLLESAPNVEELISSELVGPFKGYQKGTVLTLANGQRWAVVEGKWWAPPKEADQRRTVALKAGSFGSIYMQIENGGRPKVRLISE